ncbi:N(4)-(beta-N-acetylglucosaminyl)-L-asparaginase [Oceanotoga sp. DSM 15011]|uniref:N(4)-(beta-N-acetylglucosaminyl)-L-asparaginase n=1 Tax=Oceanotoga sp. DSM 15011 TaxID=2984951 RepID=UPI0021F40B42|nr:N(4)-(beta-N-acetylglucosaminyl)-L-asparaginase [Oceanotoga sp. DSM 15011]UYO98936.1 N(4)-(beta-N-acetylglucosaminyl)-L-asparaginase [Oceanotoga sp. DSM 15011]
MHYGIIATWEMAFEGIKKGFELIEKNFSSEQALEKAIMDVEDNPEFSSVGFGGLPNEFCEVELDAAFMNGDTLSIGGIAGIKNFSNPVSIARSLMKNRFNNFLVAEGAEKYADLNGFKRKNMLTENAMKQWNLRREKVMKEGLSPYDGHDTVGMVALDFKKTICCATSTSGLFMKLKGRVGDSPFFGSGLYADSDIGGATATGLGEDIMKGSISYEIVRNMEIGMSPQESAEKAVFKLHKKLSDKRGKAGDISVVCMNKDGDFGAATNIDDFSFVVATDKQPLKVFKLNRFF